MHFRPVAFVSFDTASNNIFTTKTSTCVRVQNIVWLLDDDHTHTPWGYLKFTNANKNMCEYLKFIYFWPPPPPLPHTLKPLCNGRRSILFSQSYGISRAKKKQSEQQCFCLFSSSLNTWWFCFDYNETDRHFQDLQVSRLLAWSLTCVILRDLTI